MDLTSLLLAKRTVRPVWIYALILSVCVHVFGADELSSTQLARLDSITRTYRIEMCDMTIRQAATDSIGCSMGPHLMAFTRWLVRLDKPTDEILEDIDKRYEGFVSADTHAIDTTGLQWVGSPEKTVRIVAYVSSSCNLCKHIVGSLYDSLTTGSMKNKLSLVAKPYGAGIGDIALYAAASRGRFWDLFSQMRKDKRRYDKKIILAMAEKIGIPAKQFESLMSMPENRRMLKQSQAESAQNDVMYAPVFFINGKRYRSYKDPQWIIDAALYEYERVRKKDQATQQ